MLVLTRKRSESIKIGNDIVIKIIQTGQGMVKLGIEAPANVRILRAELTAFPTVDTVDQTSLKPELQSVTASSLSASSEAAHQDGPCSKLSLDDEVADLDGEIDPLIEFSTDYIMELQDQFLCVAAH